MYLFDLFLGIDPALVIVNLILNAGTDENKNFCDKCISDFDKAGGCECMEDEDCDQLSLISDGCFKCGDKAIKYCVSKEGKITKLFTIFTY